MTVPALPGWTHVYSGKVRDLYVPDDDAGTASGQGSDVVLIVASDRISAFDYVLPTTIPYKGAILTQLSLWWYEQLADLIDTHLLSLDVPAEVAGRAMICRRLEMFPLECVARGYLAGSGLAEYQRTGQVCGVPLPEGLTESSRLPEAIFTPATKAPDGEHDENITFDQATALVGAGPAEAMREATLAIYSRAAQIAAARGIILCDTKVEFGAHPTRSGALMLADEVLTPDSSRYWEADQVQEGHSAPSFDKQFVRNWLTSPESGWDRASGAEPPALPEEIVAATRERYLTAFERLTGTAFQPVS